MGAWEEAKKKAEAASSGGKFIRLQKDEEKVILHFRGDPFSREMVFLEKENKTVPFAEEHRKQGLRPSLKISLDVIDVEKGSAHIVEMNAQTFKDLCKVREKYGFEKKCFEFQRHGAKGDSKTKYSIMPERDLNAEEVARFAAIPLFNLEREVTGAGGDESGSLDDYKPGSDKAATPATGPISDTVAAELIAQLKALPREAADKFLKGLGVAKVREIPAAREADARAALKELVAPPVEDDPFA